MQEEKSEFEKLDELRKDPKTVLEIVKEINDAFKPDDKFLIEIIKKLSLQLIDRKAMSKIWDACNEFIEGYKDIKLDHGEIELAKKRFGL